MAARSRRPRGAADQRLDQALRLARSRACRADSLTPGAGDVLRARVAAAVERTVEEYLAAVSAGTPARKTVGP